MACSIRVALKTPNQKDDHARRANHKRRHFLRFNNQNQTMKRKLKYYGFSLLTVAAAMFVPLPASAQQINGTPGAASATANISGKQIPAPPITFGGGTKEDVKDSQACRPP